MSHAHVPDSPCAFCSAPRPAEYRNPRISNEATNYTFTLQTGEPAMIAFIKHYAKAIVAAIGYAASIATALGLTHYHYVSVILGVLSTIAVILTKNTTPSAAAPAGPAAR